MLYDNIRHTGSHRPRMYGLTNVNKEVIPPRSMLIAIQHVMAGYIFIFYCVFHTGSGTLL